MTTENKDMTELFNAAYERLGLIETDIDPVIIRRMYEAGFEDGRNNGYAEGHALGLKQRFEPVPPEKPPGEKKRYWGKGGGGVKPDDVRPVTEKQLAFIAKLVKQRFGITPQYNTVTESMASLFRSLEHQPIELGVGLLFDCAGAVRTTGQASQLIDKLLSMKK